MGVTQSLSRREYQGRNSTLIITETGVIIREIRRAFKPKIGEVTIPFKSIAEVHFRKPSFGAEGYIDLRIAGTPNYNARVRRTHIVTFKGKKMTALFEEARSLIEQQIAKSVNSDQIAPQNAQPAANDVVSQIERLAALKTKGILTEEEFQAQKQKILAGKL